MPLPNKALERIARVKREKAEAAALQPAANQPAIVKPAEQQFQPGMWAAYQGALPDLDGRERPAAEILIDDVIGGLGFSEAYDRYIGKARLDDDSKVEGIRISCPSPDHLDKHPSAWGNSQKKTWTCGGCNDGGDVLDLAAIKFGFDRQAIRNQGPEFGELRRAMAKDLGLHFDYVPGVGYEVTKPPGEEDVAKRFSEVAPAEPAQDQLPVAPPQPQPPPQPLDPRNRTHYYEEEKDIPILEWEKIVTPGTFLDSYMRQCCIDDVPEEFHFWYGIIGLGLVCGRDVTLYDHQAVFSNLFVVILGTTGSGKSRSKRHLVEVLRAVAPFDASNNMTGVYLVPTVASAEVLIRNFSLPEYDTTNPNSRTPQIVGYNSVRGLVDFNEFKALVQRVSRQGSTMDTTLLQFFDSEEVITSDAMTRTNLVAKNAHASLVTTVQPEVLRDLLTREGDDSGFLNRFLFVGGPQKQHRVMGTERPNLAEPIDKLAEIRRWGAKKHELKMTDEAGKLFQKAYDSYIYADMMSTGNAFARAELLIKKLCLILAINEMKNEVDVAIMQKVLDVYPYLLKFVRMRNEAQARNPANELMTLICQTLARRFGPKEGGNQLGTTSGKLMSAIAASKRPTPKDLNDALLQMCRLEILETHDHIAGNKQKFKHYWFKTPEDYLAYLPS